MPKYGGFYQGFWSLCKGKLIKGELHCKLKSSD